MAHTIIINVSSPSWPKLIKQLTKAQAKHIIIFMSSPSWPQGHHHQGHQMQGLHHQGNQASSRHLQYGFISIIIMSKHHGLHHKVQRLKAITKSYIINKHHQGHPSPLSGLHHIHQGISKLHHHQTGSISIIWAPPHQTGSISIITINQTIKGPSSALQGSMNIIYKHRSSCIML